MRPFDRGAQGSLPRVSVASAFQQIEALRKTLEDLPRGEHRGPSGGEFERERKVVERAAQLANDIVGFSLCSGAEQVDRLRLVEREDWILDLAAYAQKLPSGGEHA